MHYELKVLKNDLFVISMIFELLVFVGRNCRVLYYNSVE